LYNVFFKRTPLLGNIVIAALTAFIPLVLFFFAKDCIEKLHNEKVNLLIYLYAGFPFLIIIARELSLDISDLEGDQADGCKTLPIVIGIKKSKLIVAFVLMFSILLSVPVALRFRHLVICFILVDVLLLFYLYKLKNVETRIDYIKIGRFLWFIMIAGLAGFTIATVI
jgi:4-hydroxybenzoate polyprenyltransferase